MTRQKVVSEHSEQNKLCMKNHARKWIFFTRSILYEVLSERNDFFQICERCLQVENESSTTDLFVCGTEGKIVLQSNAC